MTVLSDRSIRIQVDTDRLGIDPFDPKVVGPASYDIRLGETLLQWAPSDATQPGDTLVDPERDQSGLWKVCTLGRGGRWLLYPHSFYLGVSLETLVIPDDLLCQLHGRSSLGRLGIQIHTTAGLVDPGWMGRLTLEITVQAGPTWLRPGQPIGQLTFSRLTSAAERPYEGRYQSDDTPTPSRLHLETPR